MQLKIGETIRSLRHRDGRTQEDLAKTLGVTCQAISRWEAGGGYPDLELLPAIANYFHVAIDELFGYHGDREEKINAILREADETLNMTGFTVREGIASPELESCVERLRTAVEEFPNEPRILLKLAKALYMLGWNKYGARAHRPEGSDFFYRGAEHNSKNPYWQEALQVYDKILSMDSTVLERETALQPMLVLCKNMGQTEKAKKIAAGQPSLYNSRELLLPEAVEGEEMAGYYGEALVTLLRETQHVLLSAWSQNCSPAVATHSVEVGYALANLYETLCGDGNCGALHFNIGGLYFSLADYHSHHDNLPEALNCFRKGFLHCRAYEQLVSEGSCRYTAPLLSYIPELTGEKLPPVAEDFWKQHLENLPEELLTLLRQDETCASLFE